MAQTLDENLVLCRHARGTCLSRGGIVCFSSHPMVLRGRASGPRRDSIAKLLRARGIVQENLAGKVQARRPSSFESCKETEMRRYARGTRQSFSVFSARTYCDCEFVSLRL